jgi:hypothetical protein
MGLFDGVFNQMNPRNDAADFAIIQENRKREQEYAGQALRRTQEIELEAMNQLRQTLDTGKFEDFQLDGWQGAEGDGLVGDDFRQYGKDFYARREVDEGNFGMDAEDILKIRGKKAFFDYINLSGMASEFLGPGKRLDETTTDIYRDENGEIMIRPKIRTVDAESGDIRTNNMTLSGRNETELASEGGQELVDQETVGDISLGEVNELMSQYKRKTADVAGINTNLRFLNQSGADYFDQGVARQDRTKALQRAVEEGKTGIASAESRLEEAETTLKNQPTENKDADADANTLNYGAGYGLAEGYEYYGDTTAFLPMGDELAALLFKEGDKIGPAEGIRGQIERFEEGAGLSVSKKAPEQKKDGYLETPGFKPKNLTEAQYLSLSPNERNRLDDMSKKQTAETLEAIHTDAYKAFNRAMDESGQTQVAEAKTWYKANKERLDKVFKTAPEKRAEFNADPVAFSKKYMNDSNALFGKPHRQQDADKQAETTAGVNNSAVVKAITDGDIDTLKEEVAKAKRLSAQQEQDLVDYIQQTHDGNLARSSGTHRSDIMINLLSSVRGDDPLFTAMAASLGVFAETGKWTLTAETLKVNQAKVLETQRNNNRAAEQWGVEQLNNISQYSTAGAKFVNTVTTADSDGNMTFFTDWEQASKLILLETTRLSTIQSNVRKKDWASTPGFLADFGMVSNYNMQVLKNYVHGKQEPGWWKEFFTAGLASNPGEKSFDLSPNTYAYDSKGEIITDVDSKDVHHFKSTDGRGSEITTGTVNAELGAKASGMILQSAVYNAIKAEAAEAAKAP